MIKIEKNIIPGRGPETSIIREMISLMEIGDSTLIETDNQNRFSSSLIRIPKRMNSSIRFKTQRINENTFRVWRIL